MNIPPLVKAAYPDPSITLPVLKRTIKMLGYSKKAVKNVKITSNSLSCIEMRFTYCQFYQEMLISDHDFFFSGSAKFHFMMYRSRAWSLNNQAPELDFSDPSKGVSLQILLSSTNILLS